MDRLIFNRLPQFQKKNIPALYFAGVFFFSACSFAETLALATDLFEKAEWELCHRECRRALISHTGPVERFQLLEAMSLVRTGANPNSAIKYFQPIIEADIDHQVTAIASYELGRLQWQLNDPEAALDSFQLAFHTTTNKALFLRSSCSLFQLFKEDRDLKEDREELVTQVSTSRDQWYGALFAETAKPDPKKNQSSAPNWIVRFYRSQISPAIGNRCTLDPSCSEYFHQAHSKHGKKSIPMIADRFVREPDVSNKKTDPVVMPSGEIRYGDPVANHDFWMKKK